MSTFWIVLLFSAIAFGVGGACAAVLSSRYCSRPPGADDIIGQLKKELRGERAARARLVEERNAWERRYGEMTALFVATFPRHSPPGERGQGAKTGDIVPLPFVRPAKDCPGCEGIVSGAKWCSECVAIANEKGILG